MSKTATGWTVVAANGNTASFPTKRQAERVAKALRAGKIGRNKVGLGIDAKVVAA